MLFGLNEVRIAGVRIMTERKPWVKEFESMGIKSREKRADIAEPRQILLKAGVFFNIFEVIYKMKKFITKFKAQIMSA